MAHWRLRLKGKEMLKLGSGVDNPHQLGLRSKISYPTVKRYIDTPEDVKAFDGEVLATVLIDGLELTPAQVLELKLGDLFQLVQED